MNGANHRQMVILLGCLAAIDPLCTDLYLPALPHITADLQTNTSSVQLSITAALLGIATGQIFIGPYSDANGRKKPLVVSLVIFIIASFLCSFATSISALIAFRFIQGIAGAGGVVLSRAIACDLYSGSELTRFFSLLMLINGSAPVFSPVIGGQILTLSNWQGIFISLGLFSILLTLTIILSINESLPKEKRNESSLKATFIGFRQLLSDKGFVGYTLVQGFIFASLFAYIAGSPFILQTNYGLSANNFSLCFAFNGLGMMLFAQLTGYFSKRVDDKHLLVFGLRLALLSSLLFLITNIMRASIILFLIPLFFIVSCIGITATASFSLAVQRHPNFAGSASGLIGVTSFVFGAIASPLVGLEDGTTAISMALVIFLANLIACISYYKLARTE